MYGASSGPTHVAQLCLRVSTRVRDRASKIVELLNKIQMLALGGVRRVGSRIGALEHVASFGTLRPDDMQRAPGAHAHATKPDASDPVIPYAHVEPARLSDNAAVASAQPEPAYESPAGTVSNGVSVHQPAIAPPALPALSSKVEEPTGTQWVVPPRARNAGIPDEVMQVLPVLCVTLQLLILILLCMVIYMLRAPDKPRASRRSKQRRKRPR